MARGLAGNLVGFLVGFTGCVGLKLGFGVFGTLVGIKVNGVTGFTDGFSVGRTVGAKDGLGAIEFCRHRGLLHLGIGVGCGEGWCAARHLGELHRNALGEIVTGAVTVGVTVLGALVGTCVGSCVFLVGNAVGEKVTGAVTVGMIVLGASVGTRVNFFGRLVGFA